MKTILSAKRQHYVARVSIFLITVALIAGMVGCGGGVVEYDLTITSTTGGSVSTPGEDTYTYDKGKVVNLVAEAEEGYQFMKWTGNVGTIADANAAMTSVTMNDDYTITASFAKEIWDWDELDAVRDTLNGIYILMDDLDSAANSGSGWQPIGNSTNPFTGTFDGQGCKISGLFINRPDEDDVGLFGYVEKGVIMNVGLPEADVTGGNHTGALVGYNERGTVGSDPTQPYSTYSTGSVTGSDTVGGLVGCNWAGIVSLSKSNADVRHASSQCWRAGGLVGSNWGNVILCNYSGNVTGDHEVGGLVGLNGGLLPLCPMGCVISCQGEYTVTGNWIVGGEVGMNLGNLDSAIFEGNVNGVPWKPMNYMALNEGTPANSHSSDTAPQGSYVGALVGWNKGTINNCITVGNVSGDTYVGGLVGYNDYEGAVSGSFAAATVEGTAYVDGLVGMNDGTVANSASGTAAQMMDIATFLGADWEICAVAVGEVNTDCRWNIAPGDYPFLSGKELEQYNLTISRTEGGEVTSPGEGTFTYYEGSMVSLVAEADEGYHFVDWTGDVGTITEEYDATTAIIVDDNYSITANFEEEGAPIKIGGILCMTGGLADMGHLISQGATLAVDEVNADGGVLDGRELELVLEDSATNDATAFEAYKKLVEVNGVEVIVGPMISGAVMSSGAYAQDMQVPMVSPSATSPAISTEPWTKWALRTCTMDDLQGGIMADIIIDEGYDTAAILVQDTQYGIGIELVVTEILEDAGVAIVESIRYDESKLDYLTELNAIKDADPDVIVQVGYHTDSAVVYEQAGSLGLGTKVWLVAEGVVGLEAATYPAAAEFMAGIDFRGCTLAPDPELPQYAAFKAAYEARWGESPGVYCDTVYDAVKLIALAIEEAGEYDGAAIMEALYEVGADYDGASGTINWNELGDRIHATYGIWELVETAPGEYEYVILEYISF